VDRVAAGWADLAVAPRAAARSPLLTMP
jgi:hypothetical protein